MQKNCRVLVVASARASLVFNVTRYHEYIYIDTQRYIVCMRTRKQDNIQLPGGINAADDEGTTSSDSQQHLSDTLKRKEM